jgi:hypothetical protein
MSANESSEIPPPAQAIITVFEAPDGADFAAPITGEKLRLRYLAQRLRALGPRPLFHLLDEGECGYPLREHLDAYARLDPDVIAALGGIHFSPPVFVIEGGWRP